MPSPLRSWRFVSVPALRSVGPMSETGSWMGMTDPSIEFPEHGAEETALHYKRKYGAGGRGSGAFRKLGCHFYFAS